MRSQPLFIIGSPRSGTTFLVNILNQHPSIHISNETRIFTLLKDMIDFRSWCPGLLGPDYRAMFVNYARSHAGTWIENFYRNELAISEPIWGDKYPGYARIWGQKASPDAIQTVASESSQNHSGATPSSCLRFIRECLPTAKFLHIHRDPRHVAYSLHRRGWVNSLNAGVAVWRQRVEEVGKFLHEIESDSYHIIAYGDLLDHSDKVTNGIAHFLGLCEPASMLEFLIQQRAHPTPFRKPVTDLTMPRPTIPEYIGNNLLRLAGPCAEALGYH